MTNIEAKRIQNSEQGIPGVIIQHAKWMQLGIGRVNYLCDEEKMGVRDLSCEETRAIMIHNFYELCYKNGEAKMSDSDFWSSLKHFSQCPEEQCQALYLMTSMDLYFTPTEMITVLDAYIKKYPRDILLVKQE
jgi:hypothetical protein